ITRFRAQDSPAGSAAGAVAGQEGLELVLGGGPAVGRRLEEDGVAAAGGDEGDVVAAGEPALVEEGELPLGRGDAAEGPRVQTQPAVVVAGVPGRERALEAALGDEGGHAVGGRLDPEEALPARLGEVDERP